MKKWRVNLIFVLIILFGAVIIGRLVYIQIIRHQLYLALAQGQQNIFKPITGERGKIFFSNGEILSTNVRGSYVFVSPDQVKEKEKTAEILSAVLILDKEEVLTKLQKDSLFEKIKINLTNQEEQSLEEKNLEGVYVSEAIFREYPQGELASRTIGFLGGEEKGQYGLEGYYDDILQGKEGINISGQDSQDQVNGADIFLSLDYNLQFKAEKLLSRAKEDLNIESGQIIVMEPDSGKIFVLANFPNFNPNFYSETEDFQIFQNGAIQYLFEPGSTFKPITMAAALDREKITPSTIYIDEGKLEIGGYTIYNYNGRVFGQRTMTEVLERSINTGAVFAEKQLGNQSFLDYVEKFGFFEPTGVDLQEEVFSGNKELKKGYEINFATASFGQGIEITPLQLARAFCAIANGGKLVKPYLADKIVDNGQVKEVQPEISSERIISQKTASQITAMLISVVENGFAKSAGIPGYYIAGKTGTAQVSWSSLEIDKKGYSDKTWQSFIGFFPAFKPKFLILVKLDNPRANTAEYSALPVFRELAKYIIDYYQIPPDYEPS